MLTVPAPTMSPIRSDLIRAGSTKDADSTTTGAVNDINVFRPARMGGRHENRSSVLVAIADSEHLFAFALHRISLCIHRTLPSQSWNSRIATAPILAGQSIVQPEPSFGHAISKVGGNVELVIAEVSAVPGGHQTRPLAGPGGPPPRRAWLAVAPLRAL